MIGQRNAPNAELNVDGHMWMIFMIQLTKGKNAMTQPVTSSGLLEAPKWSISTDRQGLAPGGCGAGGGEVFGTEECNQESILLFFSASSDAEFDAVFEDAALGGWFHTLQRSMEIRSYKTGKKISSPMDRYWKRLSTTGVEQCLEEQ